MKASHLFIIFFAALLSIPTVHAKSASPISIPVYYELPQQVNGCYEINSVKELYGFGAIVNGADDVKRDSCACGKLNADIIVNEGDNDMPWPPLMGFCGSFDGNGKMIYGLYLNKPDLDGVAFFGRAHPPKENPEKRIVIKNLDLRNSKFVADLSVGILIGSGSNVDIDNVHTGGYIGGRYHVGAIAGVLSHSTVKNSYNTAKGCADEQGGIFIGKASNTSISNSYNNAPFIVDCSKGYVPNRNAPFINETADTITLENVYHKATFTSTSPDTKHEVMLVLKNNAKSMNIINSFYYDIEPHGPGTLVTEREFYDGTIASLLHNYKSDSIDGSIWGQHIGVDDAPVFSGSFKVYPNIVPKTPKISDGCYQIGSVEELYGFAGIVNAAMYNITPFCGMLTADIQLNEPGQTENILTWIPIKNFDGTFDGQGHTISGLYRKKARDKDTPLDPNLGFFANISNNDALHPTQIRNLKITDATFMNVTNVGTLVGEIDSLSKEVIIENCEIKSTLGDTAHSTGSRGGLVGLHHGGILNIRTSSAEPVIYGGTYMAGFIGKTTGIVNIANSYAITELPNRYSIYGLIGEAELAQVSIENSYSLERCDLCDDGFSQEYMVGKSTLSSINYKNAFIFGYSASDQYKVLQVSTPYITNGVFAHNLHLYKNGDVEGSVWGQIVNTDPYPKLTGIIKQTVKNDKLIYPINFVTYESDTTTYRDKYISGPMTSLPTPKREGYEFAGWYDNPELEGKNYKSVPFQSSGALTYYAKWREPLKIVDNCYEIETIEQLYNFAEIHNEQAKPQSSCVKLTADLIDNQNILKNGKLNRTDTSKLSKWTPIKNFTGIFDGQGHSISGLFFANPNATTVGFFETVGIRYDSTEVIIKNLHIKDSYFLGKSSSGLIGIANDVKKLQLINVSSQSYVYGDYGDAAGLVGKFDRSNQYGCYALDIINSYHEGNVEGYYNVGGIVGNISNSNTNFIDVYHTGTVTSKSDAGGLIGNIDSKNCPVRMAYVFNNGQVNSGFFSGGLVGKSSYYNNKILVQNAYSVGDVRSPSDATGGLIGQIYENPLTLVNAFFIGHVSKNSGSDALVVNTGYEAKLSIDNVFIPEYVYTIHNSIDVTDQEFADLSLAKKLHDYSKNNVNGEGWVQVDGDAYPHFDTGITQKFAKAFIDDPETFWTKNIYVNSSSASSSSSSTAISSSSSAMSSSSSSATSSSSIRSSSSSATHSSSSWSSPSSSSCSDLSSSSWSVAIGSSSSSINAKSSSSVDSISSSSFQNGKSSSSSAKSSSSAASSSSAKSSSSSNVILSSSSREGSSSSSINAKSSSSVDSISSSSFQNDKSSSSSAKSSNSNKIKSSSSTKSSSSNRTGLEQLNDPAKLRITVEPHFIAIHGAKVGSEVTLMDLQGRILYHKLAPRADFNISKPTPGTYIIHFIGKKQIITIR